MRPKPYDRVRSRPPDDVSGHFAAFKKYSNASEWPIFPERIFSPRT